MDENLRKKIIVSVISDLVTDQRVQKECYTFYQNGYDVLLIGRKSTLTFGLESLPYKVVRFANLFKRGPLMYLLFNLQLFFFLAVKRADILWANDLDTLLPNYLISRLKRIKLVYDSHEYFTLSVYKITSRKIWEKLERFLFPRLKNVITVNDSIKNVYEQKYRVPITVIRNVPYRDGAGEKINNPLPQHKKILVMQGRGLNEHRGAEEAVLTMQFLDDSYNLYFIGKGTLIKKLKEMVAGLNLANKVTFIDVQPYKQMMAYTRQCHLGLIFERIDYNDEHRFALPNKFFDYLKAGIPVLSSKAVEITKIIDQYNVGAFIENFDPEHISERILQISRDTNLYAQWKINTSAAANELCWENEAVKLTGFLQRLT